MQAPGEYLKESFDAYVELAALKFRYESFQKEAPDKTVRVAHIDRASWMRSVAEGLEHSSEFNNLVSDFSVAFGRDPKKSDSERHALKHFFRRSQLYFRLGEGRQIDSNYFLQELLRAFDNRQIKITSIRLIEEVYFDQEVVDFITFRIQRIKKAELDELVDNKINHIFYPYAHLDTDKLSNYWFIIEERIENRCKEHFFYTDIGIAWADLFRVSRTFPDRTIQLLTLFDWETKAIAQADDTKSETQWLRFSTPVGVRVTNDFFKPPHPSPILSGLEFLPYFDSEGKEIGEAPAFYIHLDEDDVARLKDIVEQARCFLQDVDFKESDWEFISVAMGYLAKAFFTDGLEQLLWHMTALEALFGEKDEVVSSLKRRVSIILCSPEKSKTLIKKKIGELYDFRSNLVHGNVLMTHVYYGQLREAREMARESVLWFLNFLSTIHGNLKNKGISFMNYPRRKEFLVLLDSEKSDLERTRILLENLPSYLPALKDDP